MNLRLNFTNSWIERSRTKFGENIRYEGVESFLKLLKRHKTSFAFLCKKSSKNLLTISGTIRDYDLLQSLGTNYYSLYNNSSFQINQNNAFKVHKILTTRWRAINNFQSESLIRLKQLEAQ